MNIRDWPLGRIMQLPESCFGRRFPIWVELHNTPGQLTWDISELAFPEVAVIHEFTIWASGVSGHSADIRLALGDQLPTTSAMMFALEPLFSGFGFAYIEPRASRIAATTQLLLSQLRMPISTSGRRLVFELSTGLGQTVACGVCLVVSSIPTEVPDCLLSV
ncbi:hypothetical protein ES703_34742 [subsurface metagenome]